MKKVTKVQATKLEKLYENKNETMGLIYGLVDNNNTPFNECLVFASDELKAKWEIARDAPHDFETDLVSDGRGWRDSRGTFHSY